MGYSFGGAGIVGVNARETVRFRTDREFAEQNIGEVIRVAISGLHLMHQVAEQHINQSKTLLHSLLTITKKMIEDIDEQSAEFRLSFAEETFLNAFDYAQNVVRVKELQEIARVQTELISRQNQTLARQAHELGKALVHHANGMTKTATQEVNAR